MRNLKLFFISSLVAGIFGMKMYSQNFKVQPLITIPGDNIEIDVLSTNFFLDDKDTYICWINILDSVYTVYLKQLAPVISENIIIASDSIFKSRPKLAYKYEGGVVIAWERFYNNSWQVYESIFSNDQLSEPLIILDSLNNDPELTMSTHRLAWIDNGKLFMKDIYPAKSDPILVDEGDCSSPDLLKQDFSDGTIILYEKTSNDSTRIYYASYSTVAGKFEYQCLSTGIMSKKPKFGLNGDITFEDFYDNVWKCSYTVDFSMRFESTENTDCNYHNPFIFTYPVPTKSYTDETPFFLAFDSDSLTGNREVFIKTFYFGMYDSLINISKSGGDDFEPSVAYLVDSDSIFISVLWLHSENNKTDIWIGKDVFNPIYSGIEKGNEGLSSFSLTQNYPNPFNPTTKIKYTIPSVETLHATSLQYVTMKVFDILGREIATLVDEEKPAGSYEVTFNASDLSSGIYFYQLQAGEFVQTKKMILLR